MGVPAFPGILTRLLHFLLTDVSNPVPCQSLPWSSAARSGQRGINLKAFAPPRKLRAVATAAGGAIVLFALQGVGHAQTCTLLPPPVGDDLVGIAFSGSSPWSEPKAVAFPVNHVTAQDCSTATRTEVNAGHEDSPFIWPDGKRLFFAYTQDTLRASVNGQPEPFDPYPMSQCIGAHRNGQNGLAFDLHEAHITCDGVLPAAHTWLPISAHVNAEHRGFTSQDAFYGVDEGSPAVAPKYQANGNVMAFTRYTRCGGIGCGQEGDIYLSENSDATYDDATSPYKWSTPTVLGGAVNSLCVDDDPHIVNNVLYWDSNRKVTSPTSLSDCEDESSGRKRKIWYAINIGFWVGPAQLPMTGAAVGDLNWQPFITMNAQTLYWIANDPNDCWFDDDNDTTKDSGEESAACLYKATWNGSQYTNRTLIAATHPDNATIRADEGDVVLIGEPSVTSDGTYLYFEYKRKVYKHATDPAQDEYDTSIGVAATEW